MPGESVVTTLTQKWAVFPAFSSREVTSSQMRKIGIHFIIYHDWVQGSGSRAVLPLTRQQCSNHYEVPALTLASKQIWALCLDQWLYSGKKYV